MQFMQEEKHYNGFIKNGFMKIKCNNLKNVQFYNILCNYNGFMNDSVQELKEWCYKLFSATTYAKMVL